MTPKKGHSADSIFFYRKHKLAQALLLCTIASATDTVLAQESSEFALEEVVVTAQKRTESLQDVPIAVSAFSEQGLQDRGLLTGADLEKAIPNVSFGQTGFGRYNFQVRGIGSQIQGASTDVGVGVHVNNIPLAVNRLAAAEMFDVQRVEVLRGPQGTLYGRNATGGVVNTITAPAEDYRSGRLSVEYGNYDTKRVNGYFNTPLSDTFAVRLAGTSIQRDGTVVNEGTGNDVDSRDIWSTRLSAQWAPNDAFRARAVWEHFEQDDTSGGNRKHKCAADPGPEALGGVSTNPLTRSLLSTGCLDVQVEDSRSNGIANSLHTIPGAFGFASGLIFAPPGGFNPGFVMLNGNVFEGQAINPDLHRVESELDAYNIAENDMYSLDLQYSFDSGLTFSSITAYAEDTFLAQYSTLGGVPDVSYNNTPITPGGVATSPQLGSSDKLISVFVVDQNAEQFSQEFRLQSDFDGDLNFSVGGIYVDLDINNGIYGLGNGTASIASGINAVSPPEAQIYIDPNNPPSGDGHQYALNYSDYNLKASALFGEVYYDISDTIKATLGLRYTEDDKEQYAPPLEFLNPGRGFDPDAPLQQRTFKETTGRFTLDWQATDNSLIYASLSRGYKGGGFNPAREASDISYPEAFEPEFVNAIEIGSKSKFADGRGILNLTAFMYDYKDYQVSRLVNQTVINENVDAEILGLELESSFLVTESFLIDVQIGLLDTKIGDVQSIDTQNRTQGNAAFTVVNSIHSGSFGDACIVPTTEVVGLLGAIDAGLAPSFAVGLMCTGPTPFTSANALEGFEADLSGNELPSAASYTASIGAEYSMKLNSEWEGVARADYYAQAESYARIYNTEADRIKSWDNLNLSYRLISESKGLEVQLYARNLLSEDTVTNIQLNGSTTGGSRVVSGKERPMYGLRLTKNFD